VLDLDTKADTCRYLHKVTVRCMDDCLSRYLDISLSGLVGVGPSRSG